MRASKGIRPHRPQPRQRVNVRCPRCDVSIYAYLDEHAKYPKTIICKHCKIVFEANSGRIVYEDIVIPEENT